MLGAAASAGAVTPVRIRLAEVALTASGGVGAAAVALASESDTSTAAGADATRFTMLDRDGRSMAAAARVAPEDAVVAPRSAVDSAGRSLVATLRCAGCPFEDALRADVDAEPDVEDPVSVSAAAAGAAASAIPMPAAAAPTFSHPTTGSTRRLRCVANVFAIV
jgi:hypothetical protein